MALTEIQLPNKADFYRDIQNIAGEVKSRRLRWQQLSEFIQRVTTDDLDAMGVPAGQIRTDLLNFRTALDALVIAIADTDEEMDVIRRALII